MHMLCAVEEYLFLLESHIFLKVLDAQESQESQDYLLALELQLHLGALVGLEGL